MHHSTHPLTGYCGCGCQRTLRLGDDDCDGYPVGYIDHGRLCWQDRAERDRAVGAGRCFDAWLRWNSTGGLLGPEPDYHTILRLHDVLPEHDDDAISELHESIDLFGLPDYIARRAARAQLN